MFAYVDCLAGAIEDEFIGRQVNLLGRDLSPREVRVLVCAGISFAGLLYCSQGGFYYLGFIDSYGVGSNLIAGVAIETFFFNWVEDWDTVEKKIVRYIG